MKDRAEMLEQAMQQLVGATPIQDVALGERRDGRVVTASILDRDGRRHPVRLQPVRGALGVAGLGRFTAVAEGGPLIVVAEAIGPKLAAELVDRGLGYVDLAGNCHVELDDGRIVVHVEGRRRPANLRPRQRALRAAGYRVLFALLADPGLIGATVRDVEAVAGASRHAVAELLARLRDEGLVVRIGRSGHAWVPGRRAELVDRFAVGWADALRPAQLAGRFRLRDREPEAVDRAVEQGCVAHGVRFGFGGGAGAMRLTRYFRGGDTVVHVDGWNADLARAVGAAPDRDGPLVVFETIGKADLLAAIEHTAHPLLVFAELTRDADPRARDAARMVCERFLGEEAE